MSKRCLGLLFAVSIGLTLSTACKRITPVHITEEDGVINSCSKTNEYFPSGPASWSGRGLHFGDFQVEWESMFLKHMHEPSLYACATPTQESEYRFLWDRSLSKPIAARLVVHSDGSGTLFLRMLANATMLPSPLPGKKSVSRDYWYRVTLDRQITVSPEQVAHALNLFRQIRFGDHSAERGGDMDGSDWIIESRVEGKYRLTDFRNIPSDPARSFGFYLVFDLAKLSIPHQAIY